MNKNAGWLAGVRDDNSQETLTGLLEGFQALHANVHPAGLTVDHQRALHHVGPELAVDTPLRKADVMPKLRTLATYFTFCHWNHLFAK